MNYAFWQFLHRIQSLEGRINKKFIVDFRQEVKQEYPAGADCPASLLEQSSSAGASCPIVGIENADPVENQKEPEIIREVLTKSNVYFPDLFRLESEEDWPEEELIATTILIVMKVSSRTCT